MNGLRKSIMKTKDKADLSLITGDDYSIRIIQLGVNEVGHNASCLRAIRIA